jgi:phage terminase small subunit
MAQLRNRKHEIFALELASGAPLVSAFLAAGYKDSYSARYNASRLRNDLRVKDRVNELLLEYADRTAIKVEWVQNKVAPFLEVDPIELYEASADPDAPGKLELKPLTAMPERVRKAITRIRVDPETGRPVEVFLVDKLAAANTLLRSLPGGSVSRHEVSGPNGGPVEIGPAQLELLSEEQLLELDVMTLQIEDARANTETGESATAGA